MREININPLVDIIGLELSRTNLFVWATSELQIDITYRPLGNKERIPVGSVDMLIPNGDVKVTSHYTKYDETMRQIARKIDSHHEYNAIYVSAVNRENMKPEERKLPKGISNQTVFTNRWINI